MANFEEAYKNVMVYEGKYSNDPDDVGGETYKGISRVYHPSWEGWKITDQYKNDPLIRDAKTFPSCLDSDASLQILVHAFYKATFWDVWLGDQMTQDTANEMFDIAVNMGVSRAVEFIQTALSCLNKNQELYEDLVVDGKFGMKTLNALSFIVKRKETELLVKMLNVLQGSHYIDIMKKSPTQEKFARGWFSRVEIQKIG